MHFLQVFEVLGAVRSFGNWGSFGSFDLIGVSGWVWKFLEVFEILGSFRSFANLGRQRGVLENMPWRRFPLNPKNLKTLKFK